MVTENMSSGEIMSFCTQHGCSIEKRERNYGFAIFAVSDKNFPGSQREWDGRGPIRYERRMGGCTAETAEVFDLF